MKLRVMVIEETELKRTDDGLETILDGRIFEEKHDKNKIIYAYKYFNKVNDKSSGVMDNDSLKTEALTSQLDSQGQSLVRCSFLIVNTSNCNMYYSGNQGDVEQILRGAFGIRPKKIRHVADFSKFESIVDLELIHNDDAQLSYNEDDVLQVFEMPELLKDLTEGDAKPIKQAIKLYYGKEGVRLIPKKFRKLESLRDNSSVKLVARGLDFEGQSIKLDSFIAKEIIVLPECIGWEDQRNLELDILMKEVIEVIVNENI